MMHDKEERNLMKFHNISVIDVQRFNKTTTIIKKGRDLIQSKSFDIRIEINFRKLQVEKEESSKELNKSLNNFFQPQNQVQQYLDDIEEGNIIQNIIQQHSKPNFVIYTRKIQMMNQMDRCGLYKIIAFIIKEGYTSRKKRIKQLEKTLGEQTAFNLKQKRRWKK
ncbi:unnamed protein product [Paramecium pentaurelia]|uniref:Uncharacterized protein n=1 Tax=Paramecium pentaurelia TaxID=43138 RepID=A0A8S1VZH8_9CILI|nr:unnamed protein product [Paramecium pentaurelia]